MKYEQEKIKQNLEAQRYLDDLQNSTHTMSFNVPKYSDLLSESILYDSDKMHEEVSENYRFPISINATTHIKEKNPMVSAVWSRSPERVRRQEGNNYEIRREARTAMSPSPTKKIESMIQRKTPNGVKESKEDEWSRQLQMKDKEIISLRKEKDTVQKQCIKLEEAMNLLNDENQILKNRQREYEQRLRKQESKFKKELAERDKVNTAAATHSSLETSQTNSQRGIGSRYAEVMESAIKRMKQQLTELENENVKLKKIIQKKDGDLLKRRTQDQMKVMGDKSQLRKEIVESHGRIEKLKSKLNQLKKNEIAWASEKKYLLKHISKLHGKLDSNDMMEHVATMNDTPKDEPNLSLSDTSSDSENEATNEVVNQSSILPSSEKSKKEVAEGLRKTLLNALSRSGTSQEHVPQAKAQNDASPTIFDLLSTTTTALHKADEPSTTSIFIESDSEEQLFEIPSEWLNSRHMSGVGELLSDED